MIGRFIKKSCGFLYVVTDEPFRKLNAFGFNKELLLSKEINFQIVIVKCQGVYYMTRKRTILEEGVEQEFDFGVKIFLPIPLWNSTKDKFRISLSELLAPRLLPQFYHTEINNHFGLCYRFRIIKYIII